MCRAGHLSASTCSLRYRQGWRSLQGMGRAGGHSGTGMAEVTLRYRKVTASLLHSQLLCVIAAIWFPRAKSLRKVEVNSVLLSSTAEMGVSVTVDEELAPALGTCQEHQQVTRVGAAPQDSPALAAAGQVGWGQWDGNPGIP